ncbi:MAG: malic enzyme-like NAD(P)-binding protein [Vicinamibacterales bacterium]
MPLTRRALALHAAAPAGKLALALTKPCDTPDDLSLAYSPGVAAPCLAIHDDPAAVYCYTGRSNLVGVITNGSAVLGLGNIGPAAAKPVMEGKAALFKRFADIDAFDLELAAERVDDVVSACVMLQPTFGGINLEDIKAPECFEIEEALRQRLAIPVFHDDQHGTAVIVGAALLNALECVGKAATSVRVVINGAGASAIACGTHLKRLGVRPDHMIMCDSHGVIYDERPGGLNRYKGAFASATRARTLAEALAGADVFLGLSVKDSVPAALLRTMSPSPVVFALANPDPDIPYDEIRAVRADAVVATGRSDHPNQVNNLLGFPGIFRGALDTRASTINDAILLAATEAIRAVAHEPAPAVVRALYPDEDLGFGPHYLIPKPFDPRVVVRVAAAVAEAAMRTGVAGQAVDLTSYAADVARRTARPIGVAIPGGRP